MGVAAGYLLGRTKKMRLAITLGSMLAGRRVASNPIGLVRQASEVVEKNPQLAELQQRITGELFDAARSAAITSASSRLESANRALLSRRSNDDEADDEYDDYDGEDEQYDDADEDYEDDADEDDSEDDAEDDEDESDEGDEDESDEGDEPKGSRSRRTSSRRPAKKSPAKKSPARKSAAKKPTAKKSTAEKSAAKKSTGQEVAGEEVDGEEVDREEVDRQEVLEPFGVEHAEVGEAGAGQEVDGQEGTGEEVGQPALVGEALQLAVEELIEMASRANTDAMDRLKDVSQELMQNLGDRALSAVNDKVTGLTDRLGEVANGGPVGKAVSKGAEASAKGESSLVGGLKGAVSGVKDKITGGGGKKDDDATSSTNIIESIDVGVPIKVAYNQWTEFGAFPSFMKKVEEVEAEEDEKLRFKAQIFLSHRTWQATVLEQVPDEKIVWRSKGEKGHVDGAVTFHELTPNLTRILVVLEYYPQGLFEKTGNLWRAQGRRARAELRHFRRHVMTRTVLEPEEVEGWRGVIEDGEVVETHEEHVEREDEEADSEDQNDDEDSDDEDEPEDEYDEDEPEDEYEDEPEDEADDEDEPEDDAEDDDYEDDAEDLDEDEYEDDDQ